jgi:predicted metalloprotease
MRWRGRRQSANIEDRRGQRLPLGMARGGGALLPLVMRLAGTRRGLVILAIGAVILWLSGADLGSLVGAPGVVAPERDPPVAVQSPAEQERVEFLAVVLADTEDAWTDLFARAGERYERPTLVLFRDATRSACGLGQAAMGPFYCPGDRKVYLDLAFFDELAQRFAAPGDFAQAYVLAHEIGHHVQTLLGITARTAAAGSARDRAGANALSVRQELQADCFAGVWAHHAHRAREVLEQGDLEEALRAASAIGDDRLQRRTQGHVTPDSFTHGTSEQRSRWFRRGIEEGTVAACDTFSVASL